MHAPAIQTSPTQALAALVAGRAAMLGVWSTLPASPPQWLLWGCLCLDTLILLWQIGFTRMAIKSAGASAWSYLLVLVALVAVAMVGATGLNQLSRAWLLPPPQIAVPAALRVEGQTAYLSGLIDFDTFESMKATLALDDPPTGLELASSGGRIGAARGVARLVREAGLATHVTKTCASACTLVFAAGSVRTKTPEARIGFHGYRLDSGIATVNASEEATKDIATLAGYGISETFLKQAFETPHADMWFPSDAELQTAYVLTQ